MSRKSLIGLLVALGMFTITGVGCSSMQKGETVVKYSKGEPVRMGVAPSDGVYALFANTDLTNPQIQFPLKMNDPLGFTQDDNGQIWAVAGTQRERIETGTMTKSYFWRKVK